MSKVVIKDFLTIAKYLIILKKFFQLPSVIELLEVAVSFNRKWVQPCLGSFMSQNTFLSKKVLIKRSEEPSKILILIKNSYFFISEVNC